MTVTTTLYDALDAKYADFKPNLDPEAMGDDFTPLSRCQRGCCWRLVGFGAEGDFGVSIHAQKDGTFDFTLLTWTPFGLLAAGMGASLSAAEATAMVEKVMSDLADEVTSPEALAEALLRAIDGEVVEIETEEVQHDD